MWNERKKYARDFMTKEELRELANDPSKFSCLPEDDPDLWDNDSGITSMSSKSHQVSDNESSDSEYGTSDDN